MISVNKNIVPSLLFMEYQERYNDVCQLASLKAFEDGMTLLLIVSSDSQNKIDISKVWQKRQKVLIQSNTMIKNRPITKAVFILSTENYSACNINYRSSLLAVNFET